MNTVDSKANFFRQSGWMMAANMACGVFMAGAAFLAIRGLTPKTDYPIFATVLRIFILTSIPAAAIQTLLAQRIAAAITDEARRDASATARGILKLILGFWFALLIVAAVFRNQLMTWLQASDPSLIWATMFLILGSLLLPFFLGLLQGQQSFFVYGWATILNGFGRFAAVFVGIKLFQIGASGASYAAMGGFVLGTLLAFWPARRVFSAQGGRFDGAQIIKKVLILSAGAGSTTFLISVDMLLVQGFFPKEVSTFYAVAATIANALVILCVPVAAVMFPKIVRSRATASNSDAFNLAFTGTALIAVGAAIFCSIWPSFPLRILAPDSLDSAPLIPWFMWAMVPVTLYNVLINNLIAQERYKIIPWCAVLPIGYVISLYCFLSQTHLPPFAAFKRVIQILMLFSTALMLISLYYSRREDDADSGENHSQPTGAKPL